MEELRDIHSPPGVRHVTLKQLEKPVAGGSTGRGVCHSDTAFQQTPSFDRNATAVPVSLYHHKMEAQPTGER